MSLPKLVVIVAVLSLKFVRIYGGLNIHYPCVGVRNVKLTYYDEDIDEDNPDENQYHFQLVNHLPADTIVNITFVREFVSKVSTLTSEISVLSQDVYNVKIKEDHDVLSNTITGKSKPLITSVLINGTEICTQLAEGNPEENFEPQRVNLNAPSEEETNDNTICGTRKVKGTEIIVNAQETKPGDWPWHVGLYTLVLETSSVKYLCGGTLISSSTVLTSASCVSIRGVPRKPEQLTAALGRYSVVGRDGTSQDREVYKVVIHEDFNYTIALNDIAVIKLKSVAVFNDYVQPICLWSKSLSTRFEGSKIYGTTVGWGFDENKKLSNELKKAVMPIVDFVTCVKSNPLVFSLTLNDYNFCAGFKNGTSSCNGDSGSGLFVLVPDVIDDTSASATGSWYIRGITSTAIVNPNTKICDPFSYVLFTDVSKFIDWIQENK